MTQRTLQDALARPARGMGVLTVLGPDVLPLRARTPPWFKVPAPGTHLHRAIADAAHNPMLEQLCEQLTTKPPRCR